MSETPLGRGGRLRKRTEKQQESMDRQAEAAAKKAEKARKVQEKAEREKKGLKKAPSTKAKNAARQDANDDVPGAAGSITMKSINLVSKKPTGTARDSSESSVAAQSQDTLTNNAPPVVKKMGVPPSKPPGLPGASEMSMNRLVKTNMNGKPETAPPKKPYATMKSVPSGVPPVAARTMKTVPAALPPLNAKPTTPGQARPPSGSGTSTTTPSRLQLPLLSQAATTNIKMTMPGQPRRPTVIRTAPLQPASSRSPLPPSVTTTHVTVKPTTPGQARRPLVNLKSSTPSKEDSRSNSRASPTPELRLAPSRLAAPPIPPNRILGRTNSFEDAGPQPSLDDVKMLFSQTLSSEAVEDAFTTFRALIAAEAGGTGRDAITAAFADSLTIAFQCNKGKKRARSASSATEVLDAENQFPPSKVEKISTPMQEGQVALLKETAADIYRSKMFIQSFYPQKTDEWITATFNAACEELNVVGAALTSDLATQIHRTGSIYRSNLKDHGCHIATQAYGLRAGREERNILRVAALLENDTYIYPKGDQKRPACERSLSYQHEGIALFIKRTWFNNHGSLGVRRGEHLTEMPKAAIAFAATMICFSIGQWATGKFISTSFNENEWKKVYMYHETRLTAFENDGRQAEINGKVNLYTKFVQDMLYDSRIHAGIDIPLDTVMLKEDAQESWTDEYSRRRDAMLGLGACDPINGSSGTNPLDSSDDEDEILEITSTGRAFSGDSGALSDGLEDEPSDFEAEDVVHERVAKRVKKKKKAVAALSDEGEADDDEQKSEGAESENYQQLATDDIGGDHGIGSQLISEELQRDGDDAAAGEDSYQMDMTVDGEEDDQMDGEDGDSVDEYSGEE
ncbi:hypothetical protein K474DRAFT_1712309 [Panus rudis PR-1116 ss-1]|nr:hypothetical protein K474DRAFT_1712309 [Panus rudis PR-1116 ss-1]